MLSFQLRQIAGKAAGTYFVVSDNSTSQNIETFENLRVVPIISSVGLTNQLLVFEQGDIAGFTSIFGKRKRTQEKLGNFSIKTCLDMLANGQIGVINLRNYDETDTVGISSENLTLQTSNKNTITAYNNLVYENGFWVVKPERITDLVTSENIINLTNVGSEDISYFMVKAEADDVSGLTGEYTETLEEMEIEIDDFPALKSSTLFLDTFVTIYVFKNNFNDADSNEFYGDLFKNGLLDSKNLNELMVNSYSGFINKITGTLIPNVKSEFDTDISIDTRLNSVAGSTKLYAKINENIFEQEQETDMFSDLSDFQYLSELEFDNFVGGLENKENDLLMKKLSHQFNPIVDVKSEYENEDGNTFLMGSGNVNLFNYNKSFTVGMENADLLAAKNDNYVVDINVDEDNDLFDIEISNMLAFINKEKFRFDATEFYKDNLEDEGNKIITVNRGFFHNQFLLSNDLYVVYGDEEIFKRILPIKKLDLNLPETKTFKYNTLSFKELYTTEADGNTALASLNTWINNFGFAPFITPAKPEINFRIPSDYHLLTSPNDFKSWIDGTNTDKFNSVEIREMVKSNPSLQNKLQVTYQITSEFINGNVNVIEKKYNLYDDDIKTLNPETDRNVFYENGDVSNQVANIVINILVKPYFMSNIPCASFEFVFDGNLNITSDTNPIIGYNDYDFFNPEEMEFEVAIFDFDGSELDLNGDILNEYIGITPPDIKPTRKFVVINDTIEMPLLKSTITGLKLRDEQLYNGSPKRANELLDVLNYPSIVKGLKGNTDIRYFVDAFKSFVEAGYKYQFNSLVKTLDEGNRFTRAIVNEPFIKDLIASNNPNFKDATGNQTRTLKLDKYLGTGGNPLTSSVFLSKPNIASELVYYFGSGESDGYNVYPMAGAISQLFIDKTNPWDIVANSNGILSGIKNIELNPDDEDRLAMEKFGWNPIIKKGNSFVIYGDYTGKNAFKKRKALSFISNSDLLMYIKFNLYNLSLDENFKKGRYEDYIRFETEVQQFMDDLALQNAIKPNPEVICNFTNNTEDVQNAGIKLVTIIYSNFKTLDKIVFDLQLD